MGLRNNGTHIYLVSCLIALNLLCSNLQALEERDSVKNSFPRRQLALVPVPVPATSRSLSDLSPPAPIVKPNNEKKDGSNNNNKNNSLVPALVLSILGALLLACMILCCCKCKKNRNPKRDEHPLLHLNLNDFSGSSPNSHVSTPIDINKIGAISLKSESNSHLKGSKKFETPATPKIAPPPPPPPPPKKTPPPPPAPPPPGKKPGPPPPPPPNQAGPSKGPARPGLKGSTDLDAAGEEREKEKKKLKPFFWDKVMMANPDQSMVWDHIKSGSFQFSEEMMESLFGVTSDKGKNDKKDSGGLKENTPQLIKLLDPKKSQNIAISLKAKNVKVEHVIEAVNEGNELPKELIETLIKMRPTQDEELKLKLFKGDNNLLGPAEQFYKTLIKIPFVFERLNALLFMSVFHEESSSIRRDFSTLEVACGELKSSRLFLKLLEAVLKLGNRMNDGTFRGGAQAFKLDTLLKLSDVKGTDGKTTLLHFVVQQIVQSEGLRASHKNPNYPNEELSDENYHFALGLKVVSSLGDELENVKKAAGLDIDLITNNVANLGKKLVEIRKFLERFKREINGGESGFRNVLECFVENATGEAEYLIEMERKIRGMVRSTVEYFHGTGGKEEGLRIFVIVRDFLVILERVCNEVKKTSVSKPVVRKRVANGSGSGSGSGIPDPRQYLFPAIRDRRVDSSSDEED